MRIVSVIALIFRLYGYVKECVTSRLFLIICEVMQNDKRKSVDYSIKDC